MKKQPMFKPNGDGFDISPAGVMLLAADTIYGDPEETTPEGINNARELLDGILTAAFKGGFKQGDIVRTMLSRKQVSKRLAGMLQEACDAAGPYAIADVFAGLGL